MPSDGPTEFKPLVPPMPAAPPARRRVAPQTVEAAFWLVIASTALGFCTSVFTLLLGALSGHTPSITIYVIGTFVGIGLRVLFAFAVRQGANWARILLTLGAALSVIGLGAGFTVISLVLVAIAAGTAVLLWLPSSNAFFRDVAADKAELKARSLPR
jgi:hypothetical protein